MRSVTAKRGSILMIYVSVHGSYIRANEGQSAVDVSFVKSRRVARDEGEVWL